MDNRTRVLRLIERGYTTREIAEKIGITHSAVRYHREPVRRKHINDYKTNKRRDLKKQAIKYSGGACLRCSYSKCEAALTFHHLDPRQKDLLISSDKFWYWEDMLKELNKTMLLCNRCHTEHHQGLWTPDIIMIELQQKIRIECKF